MCLQRRCTNSQSAAVTLWPSVAWASHLDLSSAKHLWHVHDANGDHHEVKHVPTGFPEGPKPKGIPWRSCFWGCAEWFWHILGTFCVPTNTKLAQKVDVAKPNVERKWLLSFWVHCARLRHIYKHCIDTVTITSWSCCSWSIGIFEGSSWYKVPCRCRHYVLYTLGMSSPKIIDCRLAVVHIIYRITWYYKGDTASHYIAFTLQ